MDTVAAVSGGPDAACTEPLPPKTGALGRRWFRPPIPGCDDRGLIGYTVFLYSVSDEGPADALWAAEQILRAGTCGALLFWQNHVRPESLRPLHLAAQSSESLFFMVRPLATTRDASSAPLPLAIRAAKDGVDIQFLKRRGPVRDGPLFVALTPSPILNVKRNATVDRRPSPAVVPRSVPAEVVA
jgi:protein ImuA